MFVDLFSAYVWIYINIARINIYMQYHTVLMFIVSWD